MIAIQKFHQTVKLNWSEKINKTFVFNCINITS